MPDTSRKTVSQMLDNAFQQQEAESIAVRQLRQAKERAGLVALRLLAAQECPEDLKRWGQMHNIPTFAEYTWQAGFQAGMRAAMIVEETPDA